MTANDSMTAQDGMNDATNARRRWGQHPMLCSTGYAYLSVCPHCNRLSLHDPDQRSRLAEAERIPIEEEAAKLRLFRATRRKLPRIYCLIASTLTGVYSVLNERHDAETDALIGLDARYEQRGGSELIFELRRADHRGDVLVTPIGHTRAVRSLLTWIGKHPLPAMGKIETQSDFDVIDDVLQQSEAPAPCCIRLDARYTQRSEALFRLQPHPFWNAPIHLAAVAVEEIGANPSAVDVYSRVQAVIPELLQRHLVRR